MTADDVVLVLIWAAAIPATAFVFLYPVMARNFYREWIGRALFASSLGLATLLDLSLLSNMTNRDYLHRDFIRITVMSIVTVGANFKLLALLLGKFGAWRTARDRFTSHYSDQYDDDDPAKTFQ